MDYNHDYWLGFLSEQMVRQCVQMAKLKCPACSDKLYSPALHLHQQLSLLDKMKIHFEEVRGTLLSSIDALYSQFEDKLPHSHDLEKDRLIYCNNARVFLLTAASETIYYGRYINDMNDSFINEAFIIRRKRK